MTVRRSSSAPTRRGGGGAGPALGSVRSARRSRPPTPWSSVGAAGLVIGGVTFVLSAALLTAGARVMARVPLVPQEKRRPDATIRAVHADRLHLDVTPETRRPGVLSLRQQAGAVHVRLGDVISAPTPTTVARPILARDTPGPSGAPDLGGAATNGFFWAGDPLGAHGYPFEEVAVPSPVGPMPAWLVRPPGRRRAAVGAVPATAGGAEPRATADPGATVDAGAKAAAGGTDRDGDPGATWVIMIHGHGATRGETLRAIPVLRALGLTTLSITYRNDLGAPASADHMYHLGADEWEDAEAAIDLALEHGARRVVLAGWSMGGGIALRTSVRSAHRDRIAALVLDSPAVDWRDILDYHARMLRAPRPMRALALWMMRSPWGYRAVRLHEPIALAEMRPDFYARHLEHPTLLFHAQQDLTVPPGPSGILAGLRPDLVDYELVADASHTREWNTDPAAWERRLARFLVATLRLDVDVDHLALPVRDVASPPQPRSTGRRL